MILAVAVVGVLTAYYLGTRAGAIAAAVAGALFLAAAFIPGVKVIAYLAVAGGVAGVCWVGPRKMKKGRSPASTLLRARELMKRFKRD